MRVTGGELRGRRLRVPKTDVRPTQDRVREALFSMLGERIADAAFLDLFAGAGAVGIEAWSRGAARVCWVERGRRVLPVLRENVAALCAEAGRVVGDDVFRAIKRELPGQPFDIVFADPPYALESAAALLDGIAANPGLLASGGRVVLERDRDGPPSAAGDWTLLKTRAYGSTTLSIYERRDG